MTSPGDGKTATHHHLKIEPRLGLDPEETTNWEKVTERHIDDATREKFEGYVAEIFSALGMDLDTPGTERTPERFLRALVESTMGYEGDPKLPFPAAEARGA